MPASLMVRGLMFHTSVIWALLLSTSPVWQPMGQANTLLGYICGVSLCVSDMVRRWFCVMS